MGRKFTDTFVVQPVENYNSYVRVTLVRTVIEYLPPPLGFEQILSAGFFKKAAAVVPRGYARGGSHDYVNPLAMQ